MQNVPDFFQFQKEQEQHLLQPQFGIETKQFLPSHPMVYPDPYGQARIEPKIEEEKYGPAIRRSTRERKTPEKFRTSLLLDDEEDIGMGSLFFVFLYYVICLAHFLRENRQSECQADPKTRETRATEPAGDPAGGRGRIRGASDEPRLPDAAHRVRAR
jgi:hypothetical protein